ncbi:hypothetical protein D3C76_1450800 [compost metagenome]
MLLLCAVKVNPAAEHIGHALHQVWVGRLLLMLPAQATQRFVVLHNHLRMPGQFRHRFTTADLPLAEAVFHIEPDTM